MNTLTPGSFGLLLISCVLSTGVSLPVLAAGDGEIVIQRTVQAHMAGRSQGVDPNPVSVNVSTHILRATGELGDTDFASISSGSSITRAILPDGNLPGLSNNGGGIGLGTGGAAGHGSGGGLSNQINGSISRGMAPLNSIGNLMGGQ